MRILPFMKPKKGVTLAGVDYNPDSGGGGAVSSVNGQKGAVVLDAEDVGALPDDTPILNSDIIAPTEETSTASQAYTVGQYFINKDDDLCCVTVDIASGGNISVGTNCVVEPVGSALTSLNSKSLKKVGYNTNITSSSNKVQLSAVTSPFIIISVNDGRGNNCTITMMKELHGWNSLVFGPGATQSAGQCYWDTTNNEIIFDAQYMTDITLSANVYGY